MPQVDIKYSNDLALKVQKIFEGVEALINELDASAGACKSRAYPASEYLHAHFYLRIALLKKPHRDPDFMRNLLEKLEELVKPLLPSECYCSFELTFSSEYYSTYGYKRQKTLFLGK